MRRLASINPMLSQRLVFPFLGVYHRSDCRVLSYLSLCLRLSYDTVRALKNAATWPPLGRRCVTSAQRRAIIAHVTVLRDTCYTHILYVTHVKYLSFAGTLSQCWWNAQIEDWKKHRCIFCRSNSPIALSLMGSGFGSRSRRFERNKNVSSPSTCES